MLKITKLFLALSFSLLLVGCSNQQSTIDELNKKEIFHINQYKSNYRKYGYNISSGGKNAIPNTETLLYVGSLA